MAIVLVVVGLVCQYNGSVYLSLKPKSKSSLRPKVWSNT